MSAEWDEALPRVVGLLRAGLPPGEAWRRAGVAPPVPPAGALDRAVLAADELAARTGAPLAVMLAALARVAADAREAEAWRAAALAGPRLSARVLLWLPAVGVALSALVDARTLEVLALTPLGWALVAAGGALTWAGRAWMRRIVAAAARAGPARADALAAACVMVAAALDAGAPVPTAVEAVGAALREDGLRRIGEAWRADGGPPRGGRDAVGAGTHHAARLGTRDETWRPLLGALGPAWDAGASPAASLEAVAASALRRARTDAAIAAGEVGVRVALPLALCLLPAFVLVGLAPLLVAVVGGALGV